MNTRRIAFASLLLSTLSCASTHDDASQAQSAMRAGSTDPLEHLKVIAAPAMEGRGTGTAGHHRAAEYVAGECKAAGLKGAIASADAPYFQPFSAGGFVTDGGFVSALSELAEGAEEEFGSDLFEKGLFVSGYASPDTLHAMNEKFCAAWHASNKDKKCPTEGIAPADPRPFVKAALATENVVALLPGTGAHRDEIVLLSAHLDHLGKSGASIYFGADDNGSGSSALLAIMHQLSGRSFDRTIAFLWTSGEEKGLLGAAYFADNPPASLPLAKIKQVVNLDMVGRWDDTRFSIGTDGVAATETAARVFDSANAALERPFAKINRDIQSYARRQDGYAFTRKKVPALFVFEGLSKPTGGGSLIPQYHKTSDTIEALMTDNGGSKIRRVAEISAIAVEKLANESL